MKQAKLSQRQLESTILRQVEWDVEATDIAASESMSVHMQLATSPFVIDGTPPSLVQAMCQRAGSLGSQASCWREDRETGP